MPIDETRLHNRAPLAAASLALIAAIAVFGPACNLADLSDGRQPNLVLIVIDSLRRDPLGIYG